MRLVISYARIHPTTHAMPQKELIIKNTKWLLKMTISYLRKTWTNTALFEFALAKSDMRQLRRPKMKLKDDFLFLISPSVLQGPFTRCIIINLNDIQLILTSYFLYYSKVHYYTQFHKTCWDHGGNNPWKKPGSSNATKGQWYISSWKPEAGDNMHSFYDLSNWCCE